ncbi:MAG TPA: Hsp33 family molecular chaperone HslO [Armatimonadota bacterium]|nr:Hsp33 family molecular chaperone HslO [Armatimonadota bacterium]
MPRQTDVMIRAIAAGGAVRAFAINSTHLCERARRIQNSLPAATAALGRVLSATVMMAGTIKEGERISLRIEGDGPVGPIVAQATPDGRVRGYVHNPEINPPSTKEGKLDVGRAVGRHGELMVIRDLGLREPYVGRVPLQTGEIGDDLAYYYAYSEQQPCAVGLGVLVETDNHVAAAGGYIVQPLTGASEAVLTLLEYNIRNAPPPSDLILSRRDPAKFLDVLLDGMNWQELERITPRFYCGCTRTKSRHALEALSTRDLEEMIAEGKPAHVSCDFCGRSYEFPTEVLADLLAKKRR